MSQGIAVRLMLGVKLNTIYATLKNGKHYRLNHVFSSRAHANQMAGKIVKNERRIKLNNWVAVSARPQSAYIAGASK
jgi:IS30 family transposase